MPRLLLEDDSKKYQNIGDLGTDPSQDTIRLLLSDREHAIVTAYAQSQADQEKAWYDATSAILFERNTGYPIDYCLKNLDALSLNQIGQKYSPTQSWWKSITNSYKIGELTIERGELGQKYAVARHNGEDYSQYEAQLQELDAKIESLQDYAPRNILTMAAQSLPYTINVIKAGAIGGFVGKTITRAIPGIADDVALTVANVFSAASQVYRTTDITWGSSYYDLINNGIDEEVAWNLSHVSGFLSGAIEAGLGALIGTPIRGAVSALGAQSQSLLSRTFSRMYGNGALSRIGLFATKLLTAGFSEGLEEGVETVKNSIIDNLAYTLSDMEVPYDQRFTTKEGLRNIMGTAVEDFVWGALTGMLLGLPGTVINTRHDIRTMQTIDQIAKTAPNYDTFSKLADTFAEKQGLRKEGPLSNDQAWETSKQNVFNREANVNARQSIWSEKNTIGDIEESESYDADGNVVKNARFYDEEGNLSESKGGSPSIKVKKMSNGRYFSQDSQNTTAEGYSIRKFGSPDATDKGSDGKFPLYGQIIYTQDEDGLTIHDIVFKNGVTEEDATGMVKQFLQENPGIDITWETSTELEQNIKKTIEDSNNGSLKMEVENNEDFIATKKKLDDWLGDLGEEDPIAELKREIDSEDLQEGTERFEPKTTSKKTYNESLKSALATVIQLLGQAEGKTGVEWINAYIKDIKRGDTISQWSVIDSSGKVVQNFNAEAEAQTYAKEKGLTVKETDKLGNEKGKSRHKGATTLLLDETTNSLRAVIYYGKNSDISTFMHELNHVVMMQEGHRKEFTELFNRFRKDAKLKNFVRTNWSTFSGSFGEITNVDALFEKLYQNGSNWTRQEYEFVTSLYEAYNAQRQALQNKPLAAFFDKIASWMRKIYHSIRSTTDLNEDIVKFFDRLYGAEGAVYEGQDLTMNIGDALMYTSEAENAEDVLKQFRDTEVALLSDPNNFDSEGRHLAPNGKPSNLSYKQWVITRTPNFIRWFGDWINDPKNSSKVVDKNGEPMVLYHTTPYLFDTFRKGTTPGLSGKGIYFAIPGEGIGYYGNNRIDAFLNVRNPLTRELIKKPKYKAINNNGMGKIDADVLDNYQEFDGVMVRRDEVTVRNPNQIKSATDNNGRFSSVNDSFLYQSEIANNIESLVVAEPLDISNDSTTNDNAETVYKGIREVRNRSTGILVKFVNTAFGKIRRHKEYDPRLIGALKESFENSKYIGTYKPDFDTPRTDGTYHKQHNNIVSYSYYLNKIRLDGRDYLIRYTVQDMRHKPWKAQDHEFHSQQMVNITLNDASNLTTSAMWGEEVAASDKILARILSEVNSGNSITLFQSAYHGSSANFTELKEDYIGTGTGSTLYGYGFYMSDSAGIAKKYAASQANYKQLADWIADLESSIAQKEERITDLQVEKSFLSTDSKEYRSISQLIDNLKDTLEGNKKMLERFKKEAALDRHLYKYDIPDYDGSNYLVYDKRYLAEDIKPITDTYKALTGETIRAFEKPAIQGEDVYLVLSERLGGEKQASEFLSDIGYLGIIYTAPEAADAKNYVIFPKHIDKVSTLNHWTYRSDEEGASLYQADTLTPQEEFRVADIVSQNSQMFVEDGAEIELDTNNYKITKGNDVVISDVKKDLDSILPNSDFKNTLFQLMEKDQQLKVNVSGEEVRTFKISLTPKEYDKFLKAYEKKGKLNLDFTSSSDIEAIRNFGVSDERLNDTRDYYRQRQDVKYVVWNNTYKKTTDTQINPNKTYFYINSSSGKYKTVLNPKADELINYYEVSGSTSKVQNILFAKMKKKTMEDTSKVYNTPIFALTKGCGRARVLVERVANGVMDASTVIESCYGGSCFVDKQRDKIQYRNEYIVSKEMIMPTTTQVENWFYRVDRNGKRIAKKNTIRKFIGTSDIIREGAMGDSSHAFVIMDYEKTADKRIVDGKQYFTQNQETKAFEAVKNPSIEEIENYYQKSDKSLAETWLECMKSQDIRCNDPNNANFGKPVQTIFITAAYAPVTDEAYKRLLPYKDWFRIHTSLSGYFDANELASRIAEFEKMNDLGLEPMIRLISNIDSVEYKDGEYNFENEKKLINYLYNRIPMDERPLKGEIPRKMKGIIEKREQTQWEKEHPIHIWQFLETPFHNDTSHISSTPSGLFGVACCSVSDDLHALNPTRKTGMCVYCVRHCGTKDNAVKEINWQKKAEEVANLNIDWQREADFYVSSADFEMKYEEKGKAETVDAPKSDLTLYQKETTVDDFISETMDDYFTDENDILEKIEASVWAEQRLAVDYPERNLASVRTNDILFRLRALARQDADITEFITEANEQFATIDEPFALEDLQQIWEDTRGPLGEISTPGSLTEPNLEVTDYNEKISQFANILSDKNNFEEFLKAIQKADLSNASLFINNLITRLSTLEEGKTLSTEGFRIAYGQVLEDTGLYMDLYGQATENDYWKATNNEADGEIREELPSEFNEITSKQIADVAKDIKDSEVKEAILSGKEKTENGKVEKSIEEITARIKELEEKRKKIKKSAQDVYDARTREAMVSGRKIAQKDAEIDQLSENAADLMKTNEAERRLLINAQRRLSEASAKFKKEAMESLSLTEKELAEQFPTLAAALEGEGAFEDAELFEDALKNKNFLSNQINQVLQMYKQLMTAQKNAEVAKKVYEAKLTERQKAAIKRADLKKRLEKVNEDLKQAYKERAALKKAKDLKRALARKIMRKVSNNVNWKQARQIRAIQASIDPNFTQRLKINEEMMDIKAVRWLFAENANNPIFEGLTEEQLHKIVSQNLNDFTLDQLQMLAMIVDQLRADGLRERQAYLDSQARLVQRWRDQFMSELLKTGRVDGDEPLKETLENDREKNSVKQRLRSLSGSLLNMSRKAQMLDNNTKGAFYELLIRQKRKHFAEEYTAIRYRIKPIEDLMQNLGLDYSDFYTNHTITIDGRGVQTLPFSTILYYYLSNKNEKNKQALSYGNLVTNAEKAEIRAQADALVFENAEQKSKWKNNQVRKLGDARFSQVYEQATKIVAQKQDLMKVIEAIEKDLNSEHFEKVRELMLKVFNQEVGKEEYYLPMRRNDLKGKSAEEMLYEDIMKTVPGTRSSKNVKKGMTEDRIVISPFNQTSIDADFMKAWTDSVTDQEHLLANLEYTKLLNQIFGESLGGKVLKQYIEQAYGSGMRKDIETHLQEIANPNASREQSASDDIIRYLRGGLYSAYLGFKTSSIINQAITSPAPFLGKVNILQLLKGYMTMTMHPIEMWNTICELSPFMASRSLDPTRQLLKDEHERSKRTAKTGNKVKDTLNSIKETTGFIFGDIGLRGLDWIDRFSVAGGWWAIYQDELAKMDGGDIEANQKKAAAVADEFVYETQPLQDKTELAPLFKNKNEAVNLLTQFQTSLNVIWNNMTYDIPQALGILNGKQGMKESLQSGEYKKALGMITGYALSGALLFMIKEGFDDDDEDKEKIAKVCYSLLNQPIAGIPLVSNQVDAAVKRILTGEKSYMGGTTLYPAFEKALKIPVNVYEKNWDQALSNAWQTIALANGLPYSGIKELIAIKDEGLGALLGRRSN